MNPYISEFEKEFDVKKSLEYRLTIQFRLDGFSYAIFDNAGGQLIGFEDFLLDSFVKKEDLFHALEKALEAKGIDSKKLKSITCLIDERTNTLVPKALFEESHAANYLDFTFQLPQGNTTLFDALTTTECFNVYGVSNLLRTKIQSKWPNAHIIHSASVFIDSITDMSESTSAFVNVRSRDFDLVITKNGKLLFYNNFKYETKEDFAYFLLFAFEQSQLSGKETPVYFSGLILPDSEIIDLCGHYIQDIRFVEDPHQLQVSKALSKVPFSYYYIHYQTLRHETQV